jgi:polyphenol oxidase
MMSMTEPQPSGGFEWAQAPWGRVLRCRALADIAPHFFTDGSIGLRDSDTEWADVAALAGVPPDHLLLLRQVHGRTIATATVGRADAWTRPEADAVISNDPASAVVVRVADCAPILMADRRTGAVAAVHAGWRSTMQRIAAHAVDALQLTYGSNPSDLVAAIGPSLGQCCGEMGEEVVAAFAEAGHAGGDLERWFVRERGRKPHFDLWRANRDQLERAGLDPSRVFSADICTKTHAGAFHSYRAAGQNAGRMAAVIRAANSARTGAV